MTRFSIASVTAALLTVWAAAAVAHHSAVQYDFGSPASVTGVVKHFRAMNPHMQLVLHVEDEKGARDIEFEGHSVNNMYRAGYRDGMIAVGDTITVTIAPLRDGADGGYVTAFTTADGVRVGLGGGR